MYQLLSPPVADRAGGLNIPAFRRVRDGLLQSIHRIQTFYRNNPRSLTGTHFLIRLLGSLNISHQLDDDIFVYKVDDWAEDISMTLKMTSSIFRGRLFNPGVFYGDSVKEVLIAASDPFDIEDAVKNWADLQPIRVLTHPFCDFDLALPNGKGHSVGGGIAVITINIPMLALQYKCWRRRERSVNTDSPQSMMMFLHGFAIPNMLESQTNIAILNRIMNQYFGGEMPRPQAAHSFYLTDWSREIDHCAKYFLDAASKKSLSFDGLIDLMPCLNGSMHETLRLPKGAFSIQLQWGIVLARLVLTAYLVQQNADYNNHNNGRSLNYLDRYLRMIETNRGLEVALPAEDFRDVMGVINDGIKPYVT